MKVVLCLLAVMNGLALIVTGALYYFGFDLQWGLNPLAVIWGSPVVVAGVGVVLSTVSMIRKRDWTRGLWGIAIAAVSVAYLGLLLFRWPSVVLGETRNAPEQHVDSPGNQILALLLREECASGYYVVLDPYAKLDLWEGSLGERWKQNVNEGFKQAGI